MIAHVGDSRAYLFRDGDLIRLTRDHSLVEELVARGKLTEEQAEAHPQRSVITRALGPEPNVEVDLEAFPARDGDVFLLCSDGLTTMVPEPQLKPILERGGPLEPIGRELIAAANEAGGRDNITVILFRLEDVERRRSSLARAMAHGRIRHVRGRDADAPGHGAAGGHRRGGGGVPSLGDGRAAGDQARATGRAGVQRLRPASHLGAADAVASGRWRSSR